MIPTQEEKHLGRQAAAKDEPHGRIWNHGENPLDVHQVRNKLYNFYEDKKLRFNSPLIYVPKMHFYSFVSFHKHLVI